MTNTLKTIITCNEYADIKQEKLAFEREKIEKIKKETSYKVDLLADMQQQKLELEDKKHSLEINKACVSYLSELKDKVCYLMKEKNDIESKRLMKEEFKIA